MILQQKKLSPRNIERLCAWRKRYNDYCAQHSGTLQSCWFKAWDNLKIAERKFRESLDSLIY